MIQERPVSQVHSVEGQEQPCFGRSNVDDNSLRGSPVAASLDTGSTSSQLGGKPPPFLLELFCGTAGVCAQFRTLGGRALGVDHHLKRTRLKAAAVKLDLTQKWVQELIEREIKLKRVSAVHMGPPCGTSSRARNIPIKRKLRAKGAPNPQPLRSTTFPLGFPWLKGLNKVKVQAANELYNFAARIAWLCDECGVLFTIENPQNSLMWETPYFKPLVEKFHFHVIDACEYGSQHKKGTAFLANFQAPRLKQRCTGNHTHAAWTVKQLDTGVWSFDTAKEAEYPLPLAKELATAFIDELQQRGHVQLHDLMDDHAVKISAEAQPRRTKGPVLLAEFKTKVSIVCEKTDDPPAVVPKDALPPWQGLPIGSKRLDVQPVDNVQEGSEGRLQVLYGVYFSPEEFIQRVQELRHPFDTPLPLDEANMAAISFILEHGPAKVAAYRAEKVQFYLQRAKVLQTAEEELHESMDASIRPVMRSKRLLLFREMLNDAGIKDETLFEEVCNGFKLVGDLAPSGQFQQQWKPATLGIEQLRQTAVWAQKAVVASCKKVLQDPEVAEAVWHETLEQAGKDKQWVRGPFSASEISEKHGEQWIPSRRFGVRQGGKIRPVDDFSQFLINATVTCHEKIDLEGIDNICATARFFLGASKSGVRWQIPGDNGIATGPLSAAWPSGSERDLHGRCLDLRQAYKQLVRHPADAWAAILAVVNPVDKQVYFFEAVALPFGAISSVLAFNRAARALRTILSKVFKLVVTNFFDDFCQLEVGLLRQSAWSTAELVMSLLGWSISVGEEKRKPFEKVFEILGAVVKLPDKGSDVVEVSNKPSRLTQIQEQVEELRSQLGAAISRSRLESLKGRLLYAAGHTYGRCTQLACQLLHKFGGEGANVKVTAELIHVTAEALSVLMESKPRLVRAWSDCPPLLLFTDGAVEEGQNGVTHGAILVDPWKQCSFYFGDTIPDEFVTMWRRSGKKQVIAQAEIFPVLIAKDTWRGHVEDRSILWFLDNESARMSLVRNFSPILDNFFLLQLNARLDAAIPARHWYGRVPSRSNPADDASRLEFGAYKNSQRCQPQYAFAFQAIESFWKLLKKIEMGNMESHQNSN